jgi:Ca2+-binding RTX toxin-like protein
MTGAEVPSRMLTIDALAGNDTVDASGLAADAIAPTIVGGDGDDVLVGGPGNDILDGGLGVNTLVP